MADTGTKTSKMIFEKNTVLAYSKTHTGTARKTHSVTLTIKMQG